MLHMEDNIENLRRVTGSNLSNIIVVFGFMGTESNRLIISATGSCVDNNLVLISSTDDLDKLGGKSNLSRLVILVMDDSVLADVIKMLYSRGTEASSLMLVDAYAFSSLGFALMLKRFTGRKTLYLREVGANITIYLHGRKQSYDVYVYPHVDDEPIQFHKIRTRLKEIPNTL